MPTAYLLSPAKTSGVRARMLLNPKAQFDLAVRFQEEGISIADAFAFASGLYFRGKIAYARRFAGEGDVVRVITTNAGLADPERTIGPGELRGFAEVEIHHGEDRYVRPLRRDAERLRRQLGAGGRAVLLGSIATGKYRDLLLDVFGAQLLFPADFVGRGDMSRGALMLRSAKAGQPLSYAPVKGAALNGRRAEGYRKVRLAGA